MSETGGFCMKEGLPYIAWLFSNAAWSVSKFLVATVPISRLWRVHFELHSTSSALHLHMSVLRIDLDPLISAAYQSCVEGISASLAQ
jgi:hypothetical protein